MSTFVFVVIITAIAGIVGTGLGGLIGVLFTRNSEKIVSLLLSFAGGVMLCIVCLDLLKDALGQVPDSVGHVFFVVAMTATGFGLIYLLNAIIDKKTNPQVRHIGKDHPKTADQLSELIHSDHYDEHKKDYDQIKGKKSLSELFIAGLVMACAIALHNFPEGMVIGASYARDAITGGVGGLAMAVVIGLHNIPEGMAVSVPLVAGGMKKVKATFLTAITGAPPPPTISGCTRRSTTARMCSSARAGGRCPTKCCSPQHKSAPFFRTERRATRSPSITANAGS